MITTNKIRPGQYQFKLKGSEIAPPEGERDAQTPEEGAGLADEISVAFESNVILTQVKNLADYAQKIDDGGFDLNHTDENRVVLKNAPVLGNNFKDALGAKAPQGTVSGVVAKGRDSYLNFQPNHGDPSLFTFGGNENGGFVSREANGQTVNIVIKSDESIADVTVSSAPSTGGYVIIQ